MAGMNSLKKRQQHIVAVVLCLVFFAMLCGEVNSGKEGSVRFVLGLMQTAIYTGLALSWGYSVSRRVMQELPRNALQAIALLLTIWIILRTVKYYFVPPMTMISRYVWYGYYLPILFIPLFALFIALTIGKKDDYKLPMWALALFVVPGILLVLVMTNDLHQWVFIFPKSVSVFSDVEYSHGFGFFIIATWCISCAVTTIGILTVKCRIPGHQKMLWFPLVPIGTCIIYTIIYIRGNILFFNDFTVTLGLLIVATLEICLSIGLIQSNSHYGKLFDLPENTVKITDMNFSVIYDGKEALPMEKAFLKKAAERKTLRFEKYRIRSECIQGGHMFWHEDLSDLFKLQEELEFTNEYLQKKEATLKEERSTEQERIRLAEKNLLYNEMQSQNASRLEVLAELLDSFEKCENDKEGWEDKKTGKRDKCENREKRENSQNGKNEEEILLKIGILLAYLKRRNNLIFLSENVNTKEDDSEGEKDFPISELGNCINETEKNLEIFGISCTHNINTEKHVTFSQLISLYDALEEIIENTVYARPSYYLTVAFKEECPYLSVRISGLEQLKLPEMAGLELWQEDEDEWYLEVKTSNSFSEFYDGNFRKDAEVNFKKDVEINFRKDAEVNEKKGAYDV